VQEQYTRKNSWIQDPRQAYRDDKKHASDQEEDRQRYIAYASIVAKGGVHGRLHSVTIPDKRGIKIAKCYHGSTWRLVYVFVAVLNMLLAIWEDSTTMMGIEVADVTQSNVYIRVLDLACVCVFVLDIYLLYLYKGKDEFFTTSVKVRLGLIFGMAINTSVCLILPNAPHISRILRPFILVERLRNVKKIFFAIVESTPKIANVLLILFLHILFFGTIGHILFRGIDDTMMQPDGKGGLTCVGDFFKDAASDAASTPAAKRNIILSNVSNATVLHSTTKSNTNGLYCSTYNGVCTDYFNTLSASLLQMFILITTANYPDIMMPVYRCSNYTAIFFVTFLVLGLYILMSLVLAVIYTHFASRSKEKYKDFFIVRDKAFKLAHNLLYKASFFKGGTNEETNVDRPSSRSAINRKISKKEEANRNVVSNSSSIKIGIIEWTDMCESVNPKMPPEVAHSIFWVFDKRDTGLMSLKQFSKAMKFASLRVTMVTNTAIMRRGNRIFRLSNLSDSKMVPKRCLDLKFSLRETMRRLTGHKYFDIVFDLIIIANGIVILSIAMQHELNLKRDTVKDLELVSEAMAYVFTCEVASKIIALGFKKFWRVSWFNRIDCATVLLSLSVIMADRVIHTWQDTTYLKQVGTAALLARLVRILRILDNNAAFRRLTNTIVHVIPALWRFFGILFVVVYMFAIVGMEIFGKRLNLKQLEAMNPENVNTFKNSSYYRLNYMENNFDNFPHAMVTLFEQLVVNNWPIVMEGAMAATGWGAALYFIAFYLICVVCIMNVLVAFLIDAYQAKEVLIEMDGVDQKKSDPAKLADSFRLATADRRKLPPWHQELLEAADRHNCDISLWKLRLRESTGEMYGAIYHDDDEDNGNTKSSS
jgi:hypothetical protein